MLLARLVQLRACIVRSMFAKKSRRTLMASLQDTTSTAGRLIAADQVQGTTIYNPNGDNLGSVEDVMIDKVTGKIAYAVVGFGGFLGIGNRHYPLPWEKLSYDPSMGGYVVDLDRSVLEGAPSYADNDAVAWNDRAWDEQVYDYYGARPYWDIMP
jgi:sporulation protein YlmC with PRC-barrel domain